MVPAGIQITVTAKSWAGGVSPRLDFRADNNSFTYLEGPETGKHGKFLDTLLTASEGGMAEVTIQPQPALSLENQITIRGAAGDICHLLTALARGAMVPA